jgi:hypothetical protein
VNDEVKGGKSEKEKESGKRDTLKTVKRKDELRAAAEIQGFLRTSDAQERHENTKGGSRIKIVRKKPNTAGSKTGRRETPGRRQEVRGGKSEKYSAEGQGQKPKVTIGDNGRAQTKGETARAGTKAGYSPNKRAEQSANAHNAVVGAVSAGKRPPTASKGAADTAGRQEPRSAETAISRRYTARAVSEQDGALRGGYYPDYAARERRGKRTTAKFVLKKTNKAPVLARRVAGGIAGGVLGAGKSTLKSGLDKINPLDKKVNKSDTSDTGAESLRLAYTTTKGTAAAVRAAWHAARRAYLAVRFTVKVVYHTVRLIVKAVTELVALAANPVTWVVVGVLLIIVMLGGLIAIILGEQQEQEEQRQMMASYVWPIGLEMPVEVDLLGVSSVETQYNIGLGYYNTWRQGYFDQVDGIDMSATEDYDEWSIIGRSIINYDVKSNKHEYEMSEVFVFEETQTQLKEYWDFCIEVDQYYALAIAYVWAQKQINEENNTPGKVNGVRFYSLLAPLISARMNTFINDTLKGLICDYAIAYRGTTSCSSEDNCPGDHPFYDGHLYFESLDYVMSEDNLNFTPFERMWVELTAAGLRAQF